MHYSFNSYLQYLQCFTECRAPNFIILCLLFISNCHLYVIVKCLIHQSLEPVVEVGKLTQSKLIYV